MHSRSIGGTGHEQSAQPADEQRCHRLRRSLTGRRKAWVGLLVSLIATLLPCLAAAPAQATGDWGPDTCLEGYVWRGATPSDHVCVTGAVRAQTAYDNSMAASRRSPTGGAYGPDTCLAGWVWREAVPGDHVCVAPATRAQAAYDNTQAPLRKNSLIVWHTTYTIPPRCSGGTCTVYSTDSIPRFRISADHINIGTVFVELRRNSNNALLTSWSTYAAAAGYTPGGRVNLDTGRFDCRHGTDSYFRLRDPASTRWSAPHYVSAICNAL